MQLTHRCDAQHSTMQVIHLHNVLHTPHYTIFRSYFMRQKTDKLYSVIESFSNAMLITQSSDGLHSRPMAVAKVEPTSNTIWFATEMDSGKIDEILSNPEVNVSFQGKLGFASLTGEAKITQDQDKVDDLWSPAWKVWFPKGKDESSITLIEVHASQGEFWDASGKEGISMLVDAAKAIMNDEKPETSKSRNAKVNLD